MSFDVVLPHARISTPVTPHEMVNPRTRCLKKEMVVGGEGVFDYLRDSDGDLIKVVFFTGI